MARTMVLQLAPKLVGTQATVALATIPVATQVKTPVEATWTSPWLMEDGWCLMYPEWSKGYSAACVQKQIPKHSLECCLCIYQPLLSTLSQSSLNYLIVPQRSSSAGPQKPLRAAMIRLRITFLWFPWFLCDLESFCAQPWFACESHFCVFLRPSGSKRHPAGCRAPWFLASRW